MNARVLLVCPNGEFGGAERTALNFAAELQARGHWAPQVALLRPGNLEAELGRLKIPFRVMPTFRLSRPASWKKTIAAIRDFALSTHASLVHSEIDRKS